MNNESNELKEKITDIMDANADNDANWNDGRDPEKVVEELETLINSQRADAVIHFMKFLVTKRNFDGTRYGFTKELVEEYLKEQNI